MSKCSQCRKNPVQDNWWDKIRLSFFHWFHNDIIDLSQDKFTQGFSDGYVVGRKHQKGDDDKIIKMLSEPSTSPIEFPKFNPELVLSVDKMGIIYLGGQSIEAKKKDQLKGEAIMFKNSLLWSIITASLNEQAQAIGWTKSENVQDLMNGKMISRTIDIQEKIIKNIEKSK